MEQTPLGAAWRFRWLVLLLTILGGGLALLYASATQSSQFQATASLVVTDPRATTLFSADDAARLSADRYVDDQIAILRSDSVAQRTTELIQATQPSLAPDANELAGAVGIIETGSNEILVQYSSSDEAVAVATVNAVIEAYEQVRGEAAARESASALAQLERSIAGIDDELTGIEIQILEVRSDPARVELDDQYREAITQLIELQPQLAAATDEELIALRAELTDLDAQLARISRILSIEDASPGLIQLYQEQSQAVTRRTSLAQQRDRLLVDTELLSGGISLSSPAQFAREIRTDILTLTILGALLGLLAGSSLAYVLAVKRRRLDDSAQPGLVLQAALLAEVPVFGDEGIKSELPVLEHPASASAEAFRFAAAALELPSRRDPSHSIDAAVQPRTYLITSPGPREGKSVLTANLALAAARKGRSVLAIDADFGNQQLTVLLRGTQSSGPGITEVVEAGLEMSDGTFSLGPPGPLDLMSRGKQPTNAPDFFGLPATRAFIEKVRLLYDIVLIDGPPMLHVAYASVLAQYVDSVIVIALHGGSVTRLEDLGQRLNLIGTPLAGYVYNGIPLRYEMTLTEGSLKDVLGESI